MAALDSSVTYAGAPRLVVVSNRLPVTLQKDRRGTWRLTRASGGLITALEPILDQRGGVWVGWPGVTAEEVPNPGAYLAELNSRRGFQLRPVSLTARQHEQYYLGFANEILWPLFHDLQSRCTFVPSYWAAYREANRDFARVVADEVRPGDLVWVHDYQLLPVGEELRRRFPNQLLCFFLHIPFPTPDIFAKLPWRREMLELLTAYDLIGFQTTHDRRNFVGCVRRFLPDAVIRGRGRDQRLRRLGAETWPAAYPIGIDARDFAAMASLPGVEAAARKLCSDLQGAHLVLGADRLDYTKGIPFKLEAMRLLLTEHPELRRKICLVQIVVPSRGEIPEYQRLKLELEQLVGEINGQLAEPGWVPIHYLHRSLPREVLVTYYRAADTCLATSLKDGMNLVAKEYCACKPERDGTLILSEFAGAAVQLDGGALVVNPFDIEGLAACLRRAYEMPLRLKRERMAKLQRAILSEDVFWWVDHFVTDAMAMVRAQQRPAA